MGSIQNASDQITADALNEHGVDLLSVSHVSIVMARGVGRSAFSAVRQGRRLAPVQQTGSCRVDAFEDCGVEAPLCGRLRRDRPALGGRGHHARAAANARGGWRALQKDMG